MASRTVSVLAPNGRRQTVKCTLNTTILQILEEVCRKQCLDPQDYDIKHHNKALDTSLTVQFSGLPNNAQLELGPISKVRMESEVTVALNLEDGTRKLGTYSPSTTLSTILDNLVENSEPNPVMIYMRRELYGDDLLKTDLRSLGLTGGRAMFRLLHKSPDELKQQANVSKTIPLKPVEEKPFKRTFQPLAADEEKIEPCLEDIPSEVDVLKSEKEEENETVNHTEEEPAEVIKENKENIETEMKEDVLSAINLDDFPFIDDRRSLFFTLKNSTSRSSFTSNDPPDEFFELTLEDAKLILRDVRKRRVEAEEGGTLMTAALRKLEESKTQLRRLNQYKKCIIRVWFPDSTALQAVFLPTDLIETVHSFVKQYLSNENLPFYLFTAPPKNVLPLDKRLIDVDCVPEGAFYLGIDEKFRDHQEEILSFLKDDLKNKLTTHSIASLAALKIREECSRIKEVNEPEPGCSKNLDAPIKRNSTTTDKVPKWFKGK